MPDDENLEFLENEEETVIDDSWQDDPSFEFNTALSDVIHIEDEPIYVGEPLYIDRIRFSDKLYLIRDIEIREIVQLLVNRVSELERQINNMNGE